MLSDKVRAKIYNGIYGHVEDENPTVDVMRETDLSRVVVDHRKTYNLSPVSRITSML